MAKKKRIKVRAFVNENFDVGFIPTAASLHGLDPIPVIIADARHYKVIPKPARKARKR